MFVDTSAVVAILKREEGAELLVERIDQADRCITAPHVRLESVMVLASRFDRDPRDMQHTFDAFLEEANIRVVAIDDETARLAVEAFARFGKGRGSKAQLNFGDCLSYAAAWRANAPLLFTGEDFAHTDVVGVDRTT
jgi:ribonuclease VapC